MTLLEFKKLIRRYLVSLDDPTDTACDRAEEAVEVIHEVGRRAIELGLPRVAEICQTVTTSHLALPQARVILCECLSLIKPQSNGMLSLREAAELMGCTESGLRKIVARKGIQFFQSKPWAPIKFRREWVESYVEGHTAQKKRSLARSKPLTYQEF